jgi:RNA polymerase sigma factor (sigma-70 family)
MRNIIALKRSSRYRHRFETLVRPHFDAMYRAARRMTRSPHDAEDLVQEVCLKVFGRLDELELIEFRQAWLLKVLYHEFIDTQRRTGRSPVDIAPTGTESEVPDLIAEGTPQPDEMVDREQRIEHVLRAMQCLDADQCSLVAMHDIEGYSIDELCMLTGMPAGTIKAQLHRTRMKLGRLLSNDAIARTHLKLIGGTQ